ncbi:signal recognition particle-docking protein FtsY [Peptostreptococcaceae bacterium AGR-M142]
MFKKFIDKFIKKSDETNDEVKNDLNKEEVENKEEAQKEVNNEVVNEELNNEEVVKETIDEDIKEETLDINENEEEIISKEQNEEELEIKEEIEVTNQEITEEKEEVKEEIKEETNIDNEEEKVEGFNLFKRLKQGLKKTKEGITSRIDDVLSMYKTVDEDLLEELEEVLITSDVGVETTMFIIENLRNAIKKKNIEDPKLVRDELKIIITEILSSEEEGLNVTQSPTIVLVVGVNGVGKTTTIGKMAHRFKNEGKKVLLAAGDTFRAAAIDQLEIWADRVGVDIIKHKENSDPGAVIFDSIQAAKSRKTDILICDTAGRLHNKKNLMNELGKIFKIVEREFPNANRETLLVVDATTGQNAVQQAKVFSEACDITGIALTKLDGTAKGGVILSVKSQLNVPVKLIGVGEQMEDLQDFNSAEFAKALFEE